MKRNLTDEQLKIICTALPERMNLAELASLFETIMRIYNCSQDDRHTLGLDLAFSSPPVDKKGMN